MITVKEIAQMCNVSPSTVSNILNGRPNVGEETRQRVLEVIKETGYQPNYFAQSMRKQSSRMISILVEDLGEFSTPPIVEAAMAYCDDMGYRAILMNMRLYDKWQKDWYDDEEKVKSVLLPLIQEMQSIRVDGMLYIAGHCRHIDYFPKEFKLPGVIAYGLSENSKYPSVVIDDEKGGYDIAQYLIEQGHERIGVIAGSDMNLHTQSRLTGFCKALQEHNVSYHSEWVRYGDWKRTSGYKEAAYLVAQGVSAIFCMNDSMAAGVYDYLREQGLAVGKDISVVGYDNKDLAAYLYPALTTNEIPLRAIGQKAMELLIDRLEEKDSALGADHLVKIPCNLVCRESVKALKK
ncbi:MAG: LacI family DNA-binding transcriptional regulator [Lachnospiraceae bacterium]|nr:LacI family DNA-binding transcriptional regulator [Lachnospiraceae bacterium]